MPQIKKSFSLTLTVPLCAVLFSCSEHSSSALTSPELSSTPHYFGHTTPKHPPDEIWVNNGSEPEWMDPGKCTGSPCGAILTNLFAGLTQPHPTTLDPMPDIAERWEISDDHLTYRFFLRPAQWSDGVALTAHDFVRSWRRVVDPLTASKYASFLYVLANAQGINLSALHLTLPPSHTINTTQTAPISPAPSILDIKNELNKISPIERLVKLDHGEGYFVYVGVATTKDATGTPLNDSVSDSNNYSIIEAAREKNQHRLLNAARKGTIPYSLKTASTDLLAVRALNDTTLEVHLSAPVPYFLSMTMFYTMMPVPQHLFDKLKIQNITEDLWTRPKHIVSNGAYVMREWKFRQYMKLEKNPRYWDVKNVRNNRVKLFMVDSYNTTLNLYRAGELDYIGENASLPAEFMDHLSTYSDFHRDPYLGVYWYWLNTQKPPMDNPKLRAALKLSVDRQSLVKHITRAGQIPTADIVMDGLAGYKALNSPIYDLEKAKQLLHQAGYKSGADVPPITLIYNTSESHKQIAEAIQQMWKKGLGVDVTLENLEWKVYQSRLSSGDFQIARMGWIGDYSDPYTFLEVLSPHNGNNQSGWKNQAYGELLNRANQTLDKKKRLTLLRDAEAMAMDATPLIPLYIYMRTEMWKPYLLGHWPNFQNNHPFKYWHIDKRWYNGVPKTPAQNDPPPIHKLVQP